MIYATLVCGFVLAPDHDRRRLGPAALDRLRAVLRLRRHPVRLLGARLGRPRAGRDVHPLGGRAGAVQLHPRPRGDRHRHRLGRRAPPALGRRTPPCASSAARPSPSRSVPRSSGRSRSMATWTARAEQHQAVAAALDAAGAPASDRVMSIDASGTQYWSGRGGVVLVNDPLDTIDDVARAYDIRWLVLDRGGFGRRGRTDPRRRPAARLARAPDPDARARPPSWRSTRSCRPRPRRPSRDPTRGDRCRRSGSSSSRSSSGSCSPRRSSSRSPRTRPTTSASRATSSRAAGSSPTRCGATRRRRSSFPRAAFEVWLPLPTFLAAIPMAILGRDLRRRPVVVGRARRARAGPRLAARRGRRRGARACRSGGRGRWPSGPA